MVRTIVILLLAGAVALGLAAASPVQSADAAGELAARALALQAEGSHALALEIWAQIDASGAAFPVAQRRWLDLRLADCAWRSAVNQSDRSVLNEARRSLEGLASFETAAADRDQVWAEARESLGDLDWIRARTWNLRPALEHYLPALEWWGRSSDVAAARGRWLDIYWRMAQPPWAPGDFDTGYGRGQLPTKVAADALKLARDDDERSRARLVVGALALQDTSNPRLTARAVEQLQAVIAVGHATSAYDDALYLLAQHHSRQDDFVPALALFKELVNGFQEGQSRWRNEALNRIESITRPRLTVAVPGAFMPGSAVGFQLSTRNVERVDFELFLIAFNRDLGFSDIDDDPWSWIQGVDLTARAPLRRWAHVTGDEDDYQWRRADLALEPELERGAYLLVLMHRRKVLAR